MIAAARNLKVALTSALRLRLWQREVRRVEAAGTTPAPRRFRDVLIIASDPGQIVGSRGDDAMFSAVVAQVRAASPDGRIGVVCASAMVPKIVDELGMTPEPIWNGHGFARYMETLTRYDSVIMIGADVMDGHYGEANAVRFWSMCDIAARRGLRAFVLGCSFSDDIAPAVKKALRALTPLLKIYARDRVSKEKFDASAAITADLVADSAFLLPPTPSAPDQRAVERWAAAQRQAGRFVCAFNTHPMIFPGNDMRKVADLNARLAEILPRLAERHPVAYLLVPHDFRGGNQGDNASLRPLYDLLAPALNDRLMFAPSEARASELKALVACADLLVTGRMHLGVGALSMGVPIWGLSYQDKFIGLFEHFGLGDLRITPEQAEDASKLEAFLDKAFAEWPHARDQVRRTLPDVKAMAARNFELLRA